ncbi:hypothetical protein CVT24_003762 [Panaeolus cyanescens]|uniref:Uncharacterized protein n=1 Tax=Panaeolus cyanescens TaxID=181874 RepID=A0A409WN53_9AGAR|nr:hypothetical protein CVT24_003762 [Panaeolus cyanescens]
MTTPQNLPKAVYNPPKDVSNLATLTLICAIAPYFLVLPFALSTIPQTEDKTLILVAAFTCTFHMIYLSILYAALKPFKRRKPSFQLHPLKLNPGALGPSSSEANSCAGGLSGTSKRLQQKIDLIISLRNRTIRLAYFTLLSSWGWVGLLVLSATLTREVLRSAPGASLIITVEERLPGSQQLMGICGVQCGLMGVTIGLLAWQCAKLNKYIGITKVAKDVAPYFA